MARDVDLIAAIYDAIIDPSGWNDVVKRIAKETNSVSGGLHITHMDAIKHSYAAHISATHNADPFYTNAYVETWHKHNPLFPIAATTLPGEVRACTHITQTDKFRASAFLNEFVRPQGWADVVRLGLLHGPNSAGHLVVHRSPDAVWVEPKEWQLLETLAPHLKRAAEIHQLLSRTKATTDSLGAAVAAAGFAVFLLTEDCQVVFANAKAEDLVRRGMGSRYESGRLAAATPSLTHRLHALARGWARSDRADGDIGGTLDLPRGQNRPPLVAHVFPLAANRTVVIFDIERPAAAVFVVDPSADFGAQIRRFGARFGLTPAETRVLEEIIGGNGIPVAAARLKISGKTARTHAYHILEKTGTNRQTELIRRFFETALPGPPASV
jgi:DNA-binding CsgD family transcriptional regulator